MSQKLICSHCLRFVAENADYCPYCGEEIDHSFVPDPELEPRQGKKIRYCMYCGARLTPGEPCSCEKAVKNAASDKKRAEEEAAAAKKAAEEEAARKKAAEEAAKKKAEEAAAAEAAAKKKKAEEAAAKKAAEEAAKKKAAEEAAKKKAAEEAAAKKAAEEAAAKKTAEEAAAKKAAEEAAAKKAAEEAAAKKAAEEAARKKAAEAEAARKKAAEEAARRQGGKPSAGSDDLLAGLAELSALFGDTSNTVETPEHQVLQLSGSGVETTLPIGGSASQKAAEEALRKKAAEEAARKRAAEEALRKKAEEEAARKKAAEEKARLEAEARRKAEEARKKLEEERIREEEERKKEEEKRRKKARRKRRRLFFLLLLLLAAGYVYFFQREAAIELIERFQSEVLHRDSRAGSQTVTAEAPEQEEKAAQEAEEAEMGDAQHSAQEAEGAEQQDRPFGSGTVVQEAEENDPGDSYDVPAAEEGENDDFLSDVFDDEFTYGDDTWENAEGDDDSSEIMMQWNGDAFQIGFIDGNISVQAVTRSEIDAVRIPRISFRPENCYSSCPVYQAKSDGSLREAVNTQDGDNATTWQDGIDGPAVGEYLRFTCDEPKNISYIALKLGNWNERSGIDYYHQNNTPKQLTVRFNDLDSFTLDFPPEKEEFCLWLPYGIEAETVSVIIQDVYAGTQYDETCISEIAIYGE